MDHNRRGGQSVGAIGTLPSAQQQYRRHGEAGAGWVAFTAAGAVLTYLAAIVSWPLQDAAVNNFDHAIGFDWLVMSAMRYDAALAPRGLAIGLCQSAAADRPLDRLLPQVGLVARNGELSFWRC